VAWEAEAAGWSENEVAAALLGLARARIKMLAANRAALLFVFLV
jgi:hypothetical protein